MGSEIEDWAKSIFKGASGAAFSTEARHHGIAKGRLEGFRKAIDILGNALTSEVVTAQDSYELLKSKLKEPNDKEE